MGRGGLSPEKKEIAKLTNKQKLKGDLAAALITADIFIGVSKGGLLKPHMIKSMNQDPIIFALANPIPEIMPELAKKAGASIIATGRGDFPNQINNVLSFPGIFRGALNNHVKNITQAMLIKAAQNMAGLVKLPTVDKVLPDCFDKRVVMSVAKAIIE
jgi:malate dehydrogenase (oxaloacetate-decarboxylating)